MKITKIKLYKFYTIFRRNHVVVIIVDFDGTKHVRLACKDHKGRFTAKRFGFGIHKLQLYPDNSVTNIEGGYTYVTNWYFA